MTITDTQVNAALRAFTHTTGGYIPPYGAMRAALEAATQAAPAPIDQGPIGALAAAMWDADNTTRLSEQGPEENDRQVDRAERVIGWLRRFNYDITSTAIAHTISIDGNELRVEFERERTGKFYYEAHIGDPTPSVHPELHTVWPEGSDQYIAVPVDTLKYWRTLVDDNPQDLAPRMDAYLVKAPKEPKITLDDDPYHPPKGFKAWTEE